MQSHGRIDSRDQMNYAGDDAERPESSSVCRRTARIGVGFPRKWKSLNEEM